MWGGLELDVLKPRAGGRGRHAQCERVGLGFRVWGFRVSLGGWLHDACTSERIRRMRT